MTDTDTVIDQQFSTMLQEADGLDKSALHETKEVTATDVPAKETPKAEVTAKAAPVAKESAAKVVEGKVAQAAAPKDSVNPDDKQAKNEERKNRSWQEINAEKEKFAKERAEFEKSRQEWQRKQTSTEAYKDEHGHTAKDYRNVAKQFAAEGKHIEAEQAEQYAAGLEQKQTQLRQEQHTESLKAEWSKHYSELADKNPDLSDANSELYKGVMKALEDFPRLKEAPDGLKYAVKAALIEQERAQFDGTKAELTALKEKYEKLQRKLSIGGGSPTEAPTGDKSYKDMSQDEKFSALQQKAANADREAGFSD